MSVRAEEAAAAAKAMPPSSVTEPPLMWVMSPQHNEIFAVPSSSIKLVDHLLNVGGRIWGRGKHWSTKNPSDEYEEINLFLDDESLFLEEPCCESAKWIQSVVPDFPNKGICVLAKWTQTAPDELSALDEVFLDMGTSVVDVFNLIKKREKSSVKASVAKPAMPNVVVLKSPEDLFERLGREMPTESSDESDSDDSDASNAKPSKTPAQKKKKAAAKKRAAARKKAAKHAAPRASAKSKKKDDDEVEGEQIVYVPPAAKRGRSKSPAAVPGKRSDSKSGK